MARVRVVEPMTGSVVEVDGDSRPGKEWRPEKAEAAAPTKKAAPRKRATKKKS